MTTTIGERIAHIRGDRSQAAFASEIGAHKNSVGNYERGERTPDAAFLEKLMRAGYSANWVVTGEGPMLLKDLQASAGALERSGAAHSISLAALEQAMVLVYRAEQEKGARLSSAAAARVVRMLYDWLTNNQIPLTQQIANDVVEIQLENQIGKK